MKFSFFIQDTELTHCWRWQRWLIVEQDEDEKQGDKMRHLLSDRSPREDFPSVRDGKTRRTMCWSFSINIYTTFFPRETPRLGLSRFKLPNCDGTSAVSRLMKVTMTPMTLTLTLTPWLYCSYWPWQGCAINAEDAVIFHRLVWDSKYWSHFWRDVLRSLVSGFCKVDPCLKQQPNWDGRLQKHCLTWRHWCPKKCPKKCLKKCHKKVSHKKCPKKVSQKVP